MARVAADPAVVPRAAEPGGWGGLVYYRLHGSPEVYYSADPAANLDALAVTLAIAAGSAPVGCIFDNTALAQRRPTRSASSIACGLRRAR